jgi:DNA-binding SARP family transcriptional activator
VSSVQSAETSRPRSGTGVQLTLLNAFQLVCDDASVELPMSAQRVVAFVALRRRPLLRSHVAGSLWPDTLDERAHASLRSALWRLHRCGRDVVEAAGQELRLSNDVRVDLHDVEALARQALEGSEADGLELDPSALAGDLLPDWYDDWLVIERERFHQLRLRALEVLCERLTDADRMDEALAAGLEAVAGEPLRESAHRALVRAHLADGNAGEAIRQYRLCERLLREQLGIEPSARMEGLLRCLGGRDRVHLERRAGGSPSR